MVPLRNPSLLKMAVSTSHVVVGILLIVYSSIDLINTTLPFSLIMCCTRQGGILKF